MEIFRLEHKTTQVGPFNYRLTDIYFNKEMMRTGVFDNISEMPTPREDGLSSDLKICRVLISGLKNIYGFLNSLTLLLDVMKLLIKTQEQGMSKLPTMPDVPN